MKGEMTILSALRVPPNARLVVQAAGGRLESLSEVHAAVRQQLLAAVGELVAFAGGYQALVEAGVAPAIIREKPETVKQKNAEMDPQQSAFLSSLENQSEVLKSSLPMANESKSTPIVDGEGETETMLNLAEEIDIILQRNLAQHPSLSSRSIHLETGLDGLLQIEVDGLYYGSVEEIQDQQVKNAINQARRDWERL
jgi:hypothetical protein